MKSQFDKDSSENLMTLITNTLSYMNTDTRIQSEQSSDACLTALAISKTRQLTIPIG